MNTGMAPGRHRQPRKTATAAADCPESLDPVAGYRRIPARRMRCAKRAARNKSARYEQSVGKTGVIPRAPCHVCGAEPGFPGRAPVCFSQASRVTRACTQKAETAPIFMLVRLAPRHKSRTPQGNRQKSLHGLLYFGKQGIDAILHITQPFLRLQQIIRQAKGQEGQQNILALPSVGPQFLVCKPGG